MADPAETQERAEEAPLPQNFVTEDRCGKFAVTMGIFVERPEELERILRGVLITRAEMVLARKTIEYQGYSPHFDRVQPGEELPGYSPIIHMVNGEIDKIEWKRVA